MNNFLDDLQIIFTRDLNSFIDEIKLFPNDETIWKTVPGVSNSAGNLVLHVCGNLKNFIGRVLGNTGYVRNREEEFNRKSGNKEKLVNELHETLEVVKIVLQNFPENKLNDLYPESVGRVEITTQRFLLHLSVHLGMHLGQVGYLRRIITGNSKSTNPTSLKSIGQ